MTNVPSEMTLAWGDSARDRAPSGHNLREQGNECFAVPFSDYERLRLGLRSKQRREGADQHEEDKYYIP